MAKYKRKRGSSTTKKETTTGEECPLKAHNSPDWYTREIVPQIGANYSALTTMNPETRIMGNSQGIYVNAMIQHQCMVTVPIDEYSSYHYKMAELYAEIREVNSGASNYNPVVLGAYISKVLALRALCAHVRRGLAAVRYGNTLYRESPDVFLAISGFNKYSDEAAAYAQNYNNFTLLCKDIETLPVPPMAIMDRYEFLFDKIFADSQTTRPALVSFVPIRVGYFNAVESDGVWSYASQDVYVQPTTSSLSKISTIILNIRELYNSIITDNVVAILRGDLIKAFGATCIRRNLVASVDQPFAIGYSPDVMSQLENATLIGLATQQTVTVTMSTSGGPASIKVGWANSYSMLGITPPTRIINYHGDKAPDAATLMAITRLAVVGSGSYSDGATITSTSGVTIMASNFITVSNGSAVLLGNVMTFVYDTHSTTQSTAESGYKKLMALCTLIDHFPMVIHHTDDPFGAMFDVDNAAYISVDTLSDLTELANRSLVDAHIPRGSNGRFLR